jgi:acyl-CoA thioester hydrolase
MSLIVTNLRVMPEWIDYNGHMNLAYYVFVFEIATNAVYETWGVGERYLKKSGCSVFTLGIDVDFLSEIFENDDITITTQLLDWDHKRVHYYHRMFQAKTNKLAAINECLAMNVQLEERRGVPFPNDVQENLEKIHRQHQQFEKPAKSAQRLAIRRANGTINSAQS